MKTLLLALCLALPSCATRVYEGGLPVLATYSNASYLKFRTPKGTYLEMRNMDNSGPTRATGALVRDIGMSGILGGATLAVPR